MQLTLLGNLLSDSTTANLKYHPTQWNPTCPVLETTLSFAHSRLVSLHTNWNIGEHAHKHFGTFDRFDFPFDSRHGG